MKVNKRQATNILNALNTGVVPQKGAKVLMVGRMLEIKQIEKDLDDVALDLSKIKFFVGSYGTGKSFIQSLLKETALEKDFIVMNADLSPTTRLFANDGKAKQLYTTLLNSMANKNSNKDTLSIILDDWIDDIYNETNQNMDLTKEQITNHLKGLRNNGLNHIKDFEVVLQKYAEAFLEQDDETKDKLLMWLKGEFNTKTEAKEAIGVNSIINDNNYYDFLKIWTYFVKLVGYQGLVINLDEMVNLYKITNTPSRINNYERLLTIINDVLQGDLKGLYITFSGTMELLTDERKGLYSYDALKRRLEINSFETKENRDVAQPVIQLYPINPNELLVLLMNINELYFIANNYQSNISKEEIMFFLEKQYSVPGAEKRLTVGHLVRKFLNVLNILSNSENNSVELRKELLGQEITFEAESVEEAFDSFDDEDETEIEQPTKSVLSRFNR